MSGTIRTGGELERILAAATRGVERAVQPGGRVTAKAFIDRKHACVRVDLDGHRPAGGPMLGVSLRYPITAAGAENLRELVEQEIGDAVGQLSRLVAG
jgi:hypothetical protein